MCIVECVFIAIRDVKGDADLKGFQKVKYRLLHSNSTHYLSCLVSGIIYALLLPSTIGFFPLIVGAVLGILLGKLVFGGFGQNIFNPAAIGRIIIGISFASSFTYSGTASFGGVTILNHLNTDFNLVIGRYSLYNLFVGLQSGSMGEISALLIIISCLFLIIRKSIDFRVVLSLLLSFSLFAFIGGIALNVNPFQFLLYELFSGGILFGAVFMATDPVTSPVTGSGRVIFGFLIGLLVILIRFFGSYPEGMAFSILILNVFTPLIDYYKFSSNRKKQALTACIIIAASILIFIPLILVNFGG
jgi:electron transport complex protein RnfD